jgi:hypothetical protein
VRSRMKWVDYVIAHTKGRIRVQPCDTLCPTQTYTTVRPGLLVSTSLDGVSVRERGRWKQKNEILKKENQGEQRTSIEKALSSSC